MSLSIRHPLTRLLPIMLAAAALAAAVAPPAGAAGDETAVRIAAFEKAFHATAKQPRGAEERRAALATLDGIDSPAVAQALVTAYEELEDEVVAAEARKRDIDERLATIVKGQEFEERRTIPREARAAFEELKLEGRLV